ncbi:uncharacterized protein RSE6_12247 [Rhynchosporium secalis]|uniref:Uncharacterized protein n=1 Tax=Rhynchosporium secalis TaxID=38038 RepID=A0A1E1MPZ8_RHYSE|nr:uncharacterized protein RSE6_12247 [Rhynchosporium secalis]
MACFSTLRRSPLLLIRDPKSSNYYLPYFLYQSPSLLGSFQDQFILAVRRPGLTVVQTFSKFNVDPDMPDSKGSIAIIEAVQSGDSIIVNHLCQYKYSLKCTPFGMPLSIAAATEDLQIAEALDRHGAEVSMLPSKLKKLQS